MLYLLPFGNCQYMVQQKMQTEFLVVRKMASTGTMKKNNLKIVSQTSTTYVRPESWHIYVHCRPFAMSQRVYGITVVFFCRV